VWEDAIQKLGVYLDDVTGGIEIRSAAGYGLYLNPEAATLAGEALLRAASKSARVTGLRQDFKSDQFRLTKEYEESIKKTIAGDPPK
jgi:hypothetical protein